MKAKIVNPEMAALICQLVRTHSRVLQSTGGEQVKEIKNQSGIILSLVSAVEESVLADAAQRLPALS
jgi:hypothetical protein